MDRRRSVQSGHQPHAPGDEEHAGPQPDRKGGGQGKGPRWKKIDQQADSGDWPAIARAAAEPRGLALPAGPGAAPAPEAVLAAAPRVRNALPQGASWDGNESQYGTN